MTILINKNDKIEENNQKEPLKLKRILGNNILLTEIISEEDPYESLKKHMREESWYWDYNYDY